MAKLIGRRGKGEKMKRYNAIKQMRLYIKAQKEYTEKFIADMYFNGGMTISDWPAGDIK